MNLKKFRKEYPQYDAVPDNDLADRLWKSEAFRKQYFPKGSRQEFLKRFLGERYKGKESAAPDPVGPSKMTNRQKRNHRRSLERKRHWTQQGAADFLLEHDRRLKSGEAQLTDPMEGPSIVDRAAAAFNKFAGASDVGHAIGHYDYARAIPGGDLHGKSSLEAAATALPSTMDWAGSTLKTLGGSIAAPIGAIAGALNQAGVLSATDSKSLERDIHGLLASTAGVTPLATVKATTTKAPAKPLTRAQRNARVLADAGIKNPGLGVRSGGQGRLKVQQAIDMMPTRRFLSAIRQSRNVDKMTDLLKSEVDRLGRSVQGAIERTMKGPAGDVGDRLQDAIKPYHQKFIETGRRLLDTKVGLQPGHRIDMKAFADHVRAKLKPVGGMAATEAASVPPALRTYLNAVLKDFERGTIKSWADVKRIREKLGELSSGGSQFSRDLDQKQVAELYKVFMDTVRGSLPAKQAENWNRINQNYFVPGFDVLKKVHQRTLNLQTSDDAAKTIMRGLRESPQKVRAMLMPLNKEERLRTGEYVLRRLGEPKPGELIKGDWTLDRFITGWRGMDERAKDMMFGTKKGSELRRRLDDIAEVGENLRLANPAGLSPSGTASTITKVVEGGAGAALVLAPFSGGYAWQVYAGLAIPNTVNAGLLIGSKAVRTLMGSPKFVKWLGRTAKNTASSPQGLAKVSQSLGLLENSARSMGESERAAVQKYIRAVRAAVKAVDAKR